MEIDLPPIRGWIWLGARPFGAVAFDVATPSGRDGADDNRRIQRRAKRDVLRTRLLHPEILYALASAGHGSRVLIADGNFPIATRVAGGVRRVHLNLAPGMLSATDVLGVLVEVINVEAATVMTPPSEVEPSVFSEFRRLLGEAPISAVGREDFYGLTEGPEVALAIATGERRLYANLLLTIGVVVAE